MSDKQASSISKLELPTPSQHGETLLHPSKSKIESLWESNLSSNQDTAQTKFGPKKLAELRIAARTELVQLATKYSRQYGDFTVAPMQGPMVLAGHQPELFHPGVWYKNFYLSRLGQKFKCPAINLIVDNDICTRSAIRIPSWETGQRLPRSRLIEFDGPGDRVPYEERGIENMPLFETFENRTADAMATFVDDPLVHRLWPQVGLAANMLRFDGKPRLGHSIAAGRHRLEAELGLQTLEIPLSQIATTESFAHFVWHIISDLGCFHEIYNNSLSIYRDAHGLRSQSHPVPELERREGWMEIPFWVWSADSPQRKRAFVYPRETTFLLSDLNGWQTELKREDAVGDLIDLPQRNIKLRPRALMTTLYSRLILSDLFIHGIGGGKYDQLTDLIAARFFGFSLPKFCVCSATMKLPTDTNGDSPSDITEARQTLREMEYQPERFIRDATVEAGRIIRRKFDWIERTENQRELARRHREIMHANEELQPFIEMRRVQLLNRIQELKHQVRVNEILGSREFSFCLFPESLADEMLKM